MISHGLAREGILLGLSLGGVSMASAVPRVAISGIGVVSPYGVGRERFWSGVSRGCSGTRAIADFDASPFPCQVAAPVPSGLAVDDVPAIEERAYGGSGARPDPRRYSRASLIAVL